MKTKAETGFTLIELMIVVAVIAILGAIAYPSYTASVLKGKRAQARTALMELLQQQERFMTQRNCYLVFANPSGTATATASTDCGFTNSTAVPFKLFSGDNSTNTAYWLSASLCTANATPTQQECIMVTASPTKPGSDPAVDKLSITSAGVKSCTGTAATTNPTLCWP